MIYHCHCHPVKVAQVLNDMWSTARGNWQHEQDVPYLMFFYLQVIRPKLFVNIYFTSKTKNSYPFWVVVRITHFRDRNINFAICNFIFSFFEMTTMILFRIKHFMPALQTPNMSLMHCTNVIHYSENYLTKIPQKCHTNKIYERRKKLFCVAVT